LSAVPHVLLPYQQAWQEDKSQVRIAEKSRRIGFSWNCASECALEASEEDGCDSWYVGYNKDMAQEFIRDCAFWARQFNIACSEMEEDVFNDEGKDILTFAIRFASGWRVTALSSRPTNLRAKRGHIILDEAAFHDDLEGLIKAAMAVLMWGGKARVDIISTHNGVDNHYNKILEESKSGKRPYSVHRVTLDDALEEGLYQRICLVNGKEWSPEAEADWRQELVDWYAEDAEEELFCVPARSGGTYLSTKMIEACMVPGSVVRLDVPDEFTHWSDTAREAHVDLWCKEHIEPLLKQLPQDKLHFFGEDFGRVSDRTVIVPGYLTQDLRRKFPFAVELANVPFEQQRQALFFIVDRLPRFFKGALDATGNGAFLAEVASQKYGQDRIEQIHMSEKWYAEHLPPFKQAFEDNQLEIAKDADHLVDLSQFKKINGIPKLPKVKTASKDKKAKPRHGDAGIAYAAGYYASRLEIGEYDYEAANKNDARPTRGPRGFRSQSGGIL
jgi:phage FluMu gp28-like protein